MKETIIVPHPICEALRGQPIIPVLCQSHFHSYIAYSEILPLINDSTVVPKTTSCSYIYLPCYLFRYIYIICILSDKILIIAIHGGETLA